MSVQQYIVRKDALIRESEEFPPAFPQGYAEFVVLYADHTRIVAEAVEREKLATRHETMRADRALTALADMEQAHAAALAEAKREGWEEGHLWRNSHRLAFDAPRTLTALDPEPAVGSVVLDVYGAAWQRCKEGWALRGFDPRDNGWAWVATVGLPNSLGPVTLIHDGEAQ